MVGLAKLRRRFVEDETLVLVAAWGGLIKDELLPVVEQVCEAEQAALRQEAMQVDEPGREQQGVERSTSQDARKQDDNMKEDGVCRGDKRKADF